jgi:hypothetical protein
MVRSVARQCGASRTMWPIPGSSPGQALRDAAAPLLRMRRNVWRAHNLNSVLVFVTRGLDRGSIILRRRWIAGSSPAMTTEQANAPRPVFCQAMGAPVFSSPDKPEGAERRAAHQQYQRHARSPRCCASPMRSASASQPRMPRQSALHLRRLRPRSRTSGRGKGLRPFPAAFAALLRTSSSH